MCKLYLAYGVLVVTTEQLWLVMWNNAWRHHECTLFCLKYWLHVNNYKNNGTKFTGYLLLLALQFFMSFGLVKFSSMHL